MVTVERLHELVDALPETERARAADLLEALVHAHSSSASTEAIAVAGDAFFDSAAGAPVLRPDAPPVRSIDGFCGDFWPEDEGPDDFVNAVRTWRGECRERDAGGD
jgi:hypothetical protein